MTKNENRALRVGQLGCSGIGYSHAAAHCSTGNTELVAAFDIDPTRTAEFAEKFSIDRRFDSAQQMFESDEVDIIDIVTPDRTHTEFALAAMACGKHVLIEKPIALCVDEVDQLIASARRHGVKAMCCQSQRWVPKLREVISRVHAGDIGEPVFARYWGGCPPFWSKDAWPEFNSQGRSEYLLAHNGMHSLDLLCWLFEDQPKSVYTLGHPGDESVPLYEYFTVNAQFAGGALAMFEENRMIQPAGYPLPGYGFYVVGKEGTMVLEATTGHAASIYNRDGLHFPGSHVYMTEAENNFAGLIRAFADAIENETAVPVPLEMSRMVLAGVLAAVESFRTGQPVEVEHE